MHTIYSTFAVDFPNVSGLHQRRATRAKGPKVQRTSHITAPSAPFPAEQSR